MDWYLKVLKNYVGFRGRARRKEYWMFILVNIIFTFVLGLLDKMLGWQRAGGEGNHVQASAGEALLLSTQPGVSYSEHNLSKDKSLTRMQLWLDACPQRENPLIQKLALNMDKQQLIASPEGGMGSLQLRQQVWLHHIVLDKGESANFQLHGPRAYLQSIHGQFHALTHHEEKAALTCGDGAFIRDEANITLVADSPLRALLIDLPV
ncbi:DUF805 domain-containing protein [Escherichia coli]|nr:DUF805 domain-containing protein [Escherichia coli]EFD0786235.1 DUF805 domain-containing protein [Escherichia coli]EFD0796220.1 DUF805 domain-containing protein [Escherichia coli]